MSSLWFTLSKDLWDRNSSIGATAELMWSHRSRNLSVIVCTSKTSIRFFLFSAVLNYFSWLNYIKNTIEEAKSNQITVDGMMSHLFLVILNGGGATGSYTAKDNV